VTDRRAIAQRLGGREVRRVSAHGLEMRDVGSAIQFVGHASVTEHAYPVGPFMETIKRGAFTKTLSEQPDVVLLVGHEGLPLARSTSGTMRLSEDDRGLRVDASLDPDDPDVQALFPKVRRGDLSEMSFAFRVTRQQWSEDYDERTIHEVSLDRGDVSIVTMGANSASSFSMRDARAFLETLESHEFDELVRNVGSRRSTAKPGLDLWKARAFALKLAGEAR